MFYKNKLFAVLFFSLLSGGILYSDNAQGQLSRNNYKGSVPYRSNYQRMAAGYQHSLEIIGGKIYASGDNTDGQLGNGNNNTISIKEQIGVDSNWVLVSAGKAQSFAISANGTLWAWGKNDKGQLGLGNTSATTVPQKIGTDNRWVQISTGAAHTLAIKNNGTLWSWGENDKGQLGNGSNNSGSNPNPTQIGADENWVYASAGEKHSLALKADGSLWAFGDNILGQLGMGSINPTANNVPILISGAYTWKNVSAGGYFSAGIQSDGTLWVWGDNYYGQAANGLNTPESSPIKIGTDKDWVHVDCGRYHISAIKANGTVWTWGKNDNGVLGLGNNLQPNQPTQLSSVPRAVYIANGDGYSLILNAQGVIHAVGDNNSGQFGNGGSTTWINNSVAISSNPHDVVKVKATASGFSTMVLKSDGTIVAWGGNDDGQLGNGNTDDQFEPTSIPAAGNNNIAVAPGGWHTLAIKDNGTLWAWGDNGSGQLGIGTNSSSLLPVQVGTDSNWIAISANIGHSSGIKGDGTLWTWGSNFNGYLGNGTTLGSNVPQQVGTDSDWVSVASGSSHVIAVKANGTVWGWGRNYGGEAGGGTNTGDILTPQQIGTESDWNYPITQSMISIFMKANGTLWGIGNNGMGQIVSGGSTKYTDPTEIGNGDWLHISPGNFTTSALKVDGTVISWGGLGLFGEMGLGHNNAEPQPTAVSGIDNVKTLTGGQAHRIVLKGANRNLCAVGRNYSGEVGQGVSSQNTYNTYQCNIDFHPDIIPITSILVHTLNNAVPSISTNKGSLQLGAQIQPTTANQDVVWSIVTHTGDANINTNGLVTAIDNGTVWAKATSVQNPSMVDSLEITISNQFIEINSLAVQTSNNSAPIIDTDKGTLQLQAIILPNNANQNVNWSIISGSGHATISMSGLVTVDKDGIIWAKATALQNSNMTDSIEIVISNQIIGIDSVVVKTANNQTASISGNDKNLQLEAVIYPFNASQDVTWDIIKNDGNAIIDANGLVTAISGGVVWAKATSVQDISKADSILIVIDNNTSIQELEENLGLTLSPNPTLSSIDIKMKQNHGKLALLISNVQGQVMNIFDIAANELTKGKEFNLEHLPSGIYFIQIKGDTIQADRKIIKQ